MIDRDLSFVERDVAALVSTYRAIRKALVDAGHCGDGSLSEMVSRALADAWYRGLSEGQDDASKAIQTVVSLVSYGEPEDQTGTLVQRVRAWHERQVAEARKTLQRIVDDDDHGDKSLGELCEMAAMEVSSEHERAKEAEKKLADGYGRAKYPVESVYECGCRHIWESAGPVRCPEHDVRHTGARLVDKPIVLTARLVPEFGTEPGDSKALEELRAAIDDKLPFPSEKSEEDGDYVAAVRYAAMIIGGATRSETSLRAIQVTLPWAGEYHADFKANPQAHKDFAHALLHVTKACGKLAAVVNDAEHGGSEFHTAEVDRYLADLVICALRMANTCPGRAIDLERAVVDRLEQKDQAEKRGEKQ